MAIEIKDHVDIDSLTHLTERQKQNVTIWKNVLNAMNANHFDERMDQYFHPEMTYHNPNRPDLNSYQSWKTSPMNLYKTFPPSHYRIKDALAKGDDEIWVYCHHVGEQTGGPYMGVPPRGQEISVEWFSILKFKEGKIWRLFSIADVLNMFMAIGVIPDNLQPVDPYK